MNNCSAPAVSVVIPTYNRPADLRRCLDSLVRQTFVNFEVLVCDDGSTDATRDVATQFCGQLDVHFETAENFGGPGRPRNRGIDRARAPYVAFLDSDDWWAPTKLEQCISILDSGYDIVYHDLYLVRSISQTLFDERIKSTDPTHPMFLALLCTGFSIPNSSAIVRKKLLKKIGGLSERRDLISFEDYDCWIRLSQLTDRFIRVPKCLGYYWGGGGNISNASPVQASRVKVLYALYLKELAIADQHRAKGFLAYRIGRIADLYGDRKAAVKNMSIALRYPIDIVYRAKAAYCIMRNMM